MVVVIMGVTGSGKTTIGEALAQAMGWDFHDGDDYHPAANKAKMHAGTPLTDADRWPWLQALHDVIAAAVASGHGAVIACSALKSTYRAVLIDRLTPADVRFVLLDGDPTILAARLAHRTDHFMNPALLQSQIDTLERPADAIVIDVALPVEEQVAGIRKAIGL